MTLALFVNSPKSLAIIAHWLVGIVKQHRHQRRLILILILLVLPIGDEATALLTFGAVFIAAHCDVVVVVHLFRF